MTYEDLKNERNDYIAKLKELCVDGSLGGSEGMKCYSAILTIDELILKYFSKKEKFDILDVVKK